MTNIDKAEPLHFEPGSSYEYSNFNYVLAAAMLEEATGQKWRDLIRQMAISSGAKSIDYDDVYAILPRRVRGYARKNGKIQNIPYKDHAAYAAGGLRATPADFFLWSRAALQARLFPAALRDDMLTPRKGNYGLGWQIRRFNEHRVYNHTGGIDGFATHLALPR